jgi:protein involved in polysaccharide export with SLBB domain/capsular polysaccharide biosynthesis protein
MNVHNGPSANYADTDATGPASEYDRGRSGTTSRRRTAANTGQPQSAGSPRRRDKPSIFSFDAGSLLRPASRRWYWVIIGGILGAAGGAALGHRLWHISYSASAQMVKYEPPVASDAYRPMPQLGLTLVGFVTSPALFDRLGQRMNPPVPGSAVKWRITPRPERGSDIFNIDAAGRDGPDAVAMANAYINEVIEFTKDKQREEAEEADAYVTQMLKETETDLAAAQKELPTDLGTTNAVLAAMDAVTPSTNIIGPRLERIQAAQSKLDELLVKYMDAHPLVKAERAEISRLKSELPPGVTFDEILKNARKMPGGASVPGIATASAVATTQSLETSFYKVRSLDITRRALIARQRAIHMFKVNPPGNFRPLQYATLDTVSVRKPWLKIGLLATFFGIIGLAVASSEILRREIFDNHLKTEADVTRVTGLPVIATLGDIRPMPIAAREAWAFRTWIALQDRLAYSPNHGLICGFTSSNAGDGRSTWIHLLAGAARKCGFRVLTIATRPTAEVSFDPETGEPIPEPTVVGTGAPNVIHMPAGKNGHANGVHATNGTNGHGANGSNGSSVAVAPRLLSNPADLGNASRAFTGESEFTALTASALFTPAMVTEKLMGPESDPLVHIPLPGWTWNLERRKQWQGALNVWRKIDNVVILVELPPASMPESVLLASNLPNLLWLVQCGKAEAIETRQQLETLRHARCNLVGAVINRALTPLTQSKLSRWVGCFATFALLGLVTPGLVAADVRDPVEAPAQISPAAANAAFSIISPAQRAQWQQKLTLGPGDVLNLNLYGEPQLELNEVPIGPDGRISYLEATNVVAAGLTVDEFREKLNEELGKFRRSPQVFVTPVAYKSKKYFVLGKVTNRGAYPLDRPMTLLEAVGRAGGMETGLSTDRGLVELADLSRAFIARGGKQLPVNFEKLFLEGDLSQNVPLEPNDYIYFPGTGQAEVFVLGAVQMPGAYTYGQSVGALGAIAARGGFNGRAWKNKVLVIRGGLNRPQTFEIDATLVLSAQKPDMRLEPRDIIYVSERPWIRAEELLDAAASAFVTSAVVTWTGEKVEIGGR